MRIDNNEVVMKFTLREAQSLLLVLRRVNVHNKSPDLQGLPEGVKSDARYFQMDLEEILLLDKNLYGAR